VVVEVRLGFGSRVFLFLFRISHIPFFFLNIELRDIRTRRVSNTFWGLAHIGFVLVSRVFFCFVFFCF
jgi:hypothetical protein